MEPKQALIALCIGHSRLVNGRPEGGARSVTGASEWMFNREFAVTLQEKLRRAGLKSFIVDRYEGDGYTAAMKWLARHLKDEGATHALEIHFNAANGKARGHEFLFWHSSKTGEKMAKALDVEFTEWFKNDLPRRGPKPLDSSDRGGLFLNLTHCPAVITEAFFGDNEADWTFASEVDNQYLIAGAMTKALKEALA